MSAGASEALSVHFRQQITFMQLHHIRFGRWADGSEADESAVHEQALELDAFRSEFFTQRVERIHLHQHIINLRVGDDAGIMLSPDHARQFRECGQVFLRGRQNLYHG